MIKFGMSHVWVSPAEFPREPDHRVFGNPCGGVSIWSQTLNLTVFSLFQPKMRYRGWVKLELRRKLGGHSTGIV